MTGMCKLTGKLISGESFVTQCLEDLLSTAKGTRLMVPEYGLDVESHIDRPMSPFYKTELNADISESFDRWLPGIKLERASVTIEEGHAKVQLTHTYGNSEASIV